ncbi:MAG: hypothetical protein GY859_44055, partial [Desulfobacterales bacterium]|nr:hypothetical protein [Desulfobacterales bacterium]
IFVGRIKDHLAVNHPDLEYGDIQRTRRIEPENLPYLAASLPYRTLRIEEEYTEIPVDKRYRIRLMLYRGLTTFIDYTANLPEIIGRGLTISYEPAEEADAEVMYSYENIDEIPPYLVNLKPVLKIDGENAALGEGSIGMGVIHQSVIHFMAPTGKLNKIPAVENNIIAGVYQAVGLKAGKLSPTVFFPRFPGRALNMDDLQGEMFWRSAMDYLARLSRGYEKAARVMNMVYLTDVDAAILARDISVTYSFGAPLSVAFKGLSVDADRVIVTPASVGGDEAKAKDFMLLTGLEGSIAENRIFEDVYDAPAVSAAKVLELANDMDIPICTIRDDIQTDCPLLDVSGSVRTAMEEALATGNHILTPQTEINYQAWRGTGYIAMDPETGFAGYMLAGASGGATCFNNYMWYKNAVVRWRWYCDPTADIVHAAIHSPPNYSCFPYLTEEEYDDSKVIHIAVAYTGLCGSRTMSGEITYFLEESLPTGAYEYHMESSGSGSSTGLESIMYSIVDADLRFQDLPEETEDAPNEEDPGGFIMLNNNDNAGMGEGGAGEGNGV